MNISIVASGTRGDVQPYVALGKGLQEAGYTVRVLTSDDFESLVREAGLDFCSVGGSIESTLQSDEWRKTIEGGNFLKILSRMTSETKKRAQDLAIKIPTLFKGTDLIITGVGGAGGPFSIAEKFKIPVIQAYVFPLAPTNHYSSPLTATLPLGKMFNRLSFRMMRQMLWQTTRIADVETRKQLGLPPASFWGPFKRLEQERVPAIYGYSQHVLPRPNDWDELTQIAGYWFLDVADSWMPPTDLVEFLADGAPPVYIGFGSMGNRHPEETTRLALQALEMSGQRGVLASGWGGLSQSNLPKSVHMISSIPHSWLFPQMASVVHHGGAGTTAAGLRAGVPSIIVPFFGDQPFWGLRVAQLGVGTAAIPKKKLTAERLAQAITQSVSDSTMRQKAKQLGEKIRAEDGVGNAVQLINQIVRKG